jgi:hypothetical protein
MATKPRSKSVVVDDKRKVFADAVLNGSTQSEAARIAGYHPQNATQVMRQEDVQCYIEEARNEISDLSTLKRLDVVNILLEAVDMARMMADPGQMINGADKLAKMMGYYAPETIKLEVEGNQSALAAKFKSLTDSELLEIAAGRAKVIDGSCEVVQ